MAYDRARNRLRALHNSGLTWREIAKLDEYKPLKHGTLCSFAKGGYVPKDNEIRRILGLPEIITQEAYRNNKGRFVSKSD